MAKSCTLAVEFALLRPNENRTYVGDFAATFYRMDKKDSPGALDEKGELACKGEPAEVAFSRRENMGFANLCWSSKALLPTKFAPRVEKKEKGGIMPHSLCLMKI